MDFEKYCNKPIPQQLMKELEEMQNVLFYKIAQTQSNQEVFKSHRIDRNSEPRAQQAQDSFSSENKTWQTTGLQH